MEQTYKPGDSIRITREYYDSLLIEARHLDAVLPDTRVELFGETFETPVMMAALSHLDKARENGSVLIAEGARAAGSLMWIGMGGEEELDRIIATGAKTVKIIKPYADRDLVYKKLEHARRCGALAVGMDVDHQFGRNGQYDVVVGMPMKPVSTQELKALVDAAGLPFVVKGVLGVQDAIKCAEAGAAAIVVSHHHGVIDFALPPPMVLPEIAAAVKGKMKIFVDCGIASGYDVFKALALGADAVSVGKVMLDVMVKQGAQGVTEKIQAMTEELAGVMARTCTSSVCHVDPALLRKGF